MRKMAPNGYVLHVDLGDVRELVSLQRRCANNPNQVAIHVFTLLAQDCRPSSFSSSIILSTLEISFPR